MEISAIPRTLNQDCAIFTYHLPIYTLLNILYCKDLSRVLAVPQAPNVTVIVGLEARAGQESNAERERAVREILSRVKAVHVFTHPEKVPGHIKGCGSNQSWAMNQFLEHVEEDVAWWGEHG